MSMIKKIKDLNKEEKIMLLKAIANEEVDKNCLNDQTLICIEKGDMFLGLMKTATIEDKKNSINFVCIGDAREEKRKLLDILSTD
jgi:hypothetical protein